MAKMRGIKPDTFTDDKVLELSPLARWLFVGMWTQACDNGHLDDKPVQLKVRLLPMDNCDIDALIQELLDTGQVTRHDGWLKVEKLSDHQRIDRRYLALCRWCEMDEDVVYYPDDRSTRRAPKTTSTTSPSAQGAPDEPTKGTHAQDADSLAVHDENATSPRSDHDENTTSPRSDHAGYTSSTQRAPAGDTSGTRRAHAVEGEGEKKVKVKVNNPPTPRGGTPARSRAVRLPDDWQPNDTHRKIAGEVGVDIDVEAVKMRDWAASEGKTAKDWDARFRNWLRKAGEMRPRTSGGYGGAPPGVSRMELWAQSAQNLETRLNSGHASLHAIGGAG